MSRKALFFDVDGTLLSETLHIVPESAKRAIAETRKEGNLVFINSGRAYRNLSDIFGLVETDGYLCGCGTYVIAGGQVIYSYRIPHERGKEIKKAIVAFGCDGVLEAAEACYFRKQDSRIPILKALKESMKKRGHCGAYGWEEDCYEFDKFCVYADEQSDTKGLIEFLKPDIDVIDRGNNMYECVPAGHTKATAIDMVLRKFEIPLKDAYVFGDSSNDMAMFEHVPNAVLMGHHDAVLEPYASFITKTVEEDGIEYAMKTLGLISEKQ